MIYILAVAKQRFAKILARFIIRINNEGGKFEYYKCVVLLFRSVCSIRIDIYIIAMSHHVSPSFTRFHHVSSSFSYNNLSHSSWSWSQHVHVFTNLWVLCINVVHVIFLSHFDVTCSVRLHELCTSLTIRTSDSWPNSSRWLQRLTPLLWASGRCQNMW